VTDTTTLPTSWLRSGSRIVFAAIVVWLNLLNVSVLTTSAVNDIGSDAGVSVWSALLAALGLAPFLVAFMQWRRVRQAGLETTAAAWCCIVSLLVLGVVSLPFTLLVIAA
jgi:hypothetical protein